MIGLLGWIATAISIIGILLNAKKNIWCWPVWLVSNVLWITYFIILTNPQSITLWVVFALFNVYGWIQWSKDKKKIPQKSREANWVIHQTFGPHKNRRKRR